MMNRPSARQIAALTGAGRNPALSAVTFMYSGVGTRTYGRLYQRSSFGTPLEITHVPSLVTQ